jgi:hypothetical protein
VCQDGKLHLRILQQGLGGEIDGLELEPGLDVDEQRLDVDEQINESTRNAQPSRLRKRQAPRNASSSNLSKKSEKDKTSSSADSPVEIRPQSALRTKTRLPVDSPLNGSYIHPYLT